MLVYCRPVPYSWTPRLSVGVTEIDRQHQELFSRLNGFFQAIREGKGTDEVNATLAFLRSYVAVHFEAEQVLMRRFEYPARVAHEAEHAHFAEQLEWLSERLSAEGVSASLVEEAEIELAGWLVRHVMGTDRTLATFVSPKLS
jgi:hemerythrin